MEGSKGSFTLLLPPISISPLFETAALPRHPCTRRLRFADLVSARTPTAPPNRRGGYWRTSCAEFASARREIRHSGRSRGRMLVFQFAIY